VTKVCRDENRMVDTAEIKAAMARKGIDMKKLSDRMGLHYQTIRNKFQWGNWSVAEAYDLCEILDLDLISVFFAKPELRHVS